MTPRNSVRVGESTFPHMSCSQNFIVSYQQPSSPSCLQAQADGSKQVPTLSGQFRQSLDSLMEALSACQPFFIRCFKPNDQKQPKVSAPGRQRWYVYVPTSHQSKSRKFSTSLDKLVSQMLAGPVRCPVLLQVFDRNLCLHQLNCFGLMDTIHIRKLGYPIRHSLEYFQNRYRVLLDRSACHPKVVDSFFFFFTCLLSV